MFAKRRWGGIFDIDRKKIEIEEEELRSQAPDFWEDAKKAEEQMKKLKELKSWVNAYEAIKTATADSLASAVFVNTYWQAKDYEL